MHVNTDNLTYVMNGVILAIIRLQDTLKPTWMVCVEEGFDIESTLCNHLTSPCMM